MACVSPRSIAFKNITKAISTSLGVEVDPKEVLSLLNSFNGFNNLPANFALTPKGLQESGVIDYLENYYRINRYMEVDSKSDYDAYVEVFDLLKDQINVPVEDTEEFRELASDLIEATSNTSVLIKLADGKVMLRVPAIKYKKKIIGNDSKSESTITFTTSTVGGSAAAQYHARTKENADWSDITIALAEDFSTSGETLTAQLAGSKDVKHLGKREPLKSKDKYVPLDMKNTPTEEWAHQIISIIEKKGLPTKNIKLNIAGNGIYSLKEEQEYYDRELKALLKELQANGITIVEVRTGGQTGIDEAGAKAASSLGIKTEVHAPKDYHFKDKKGSKSDKAAFQERFNTSTSEESGYKPYDSSLNSIQSKSAVKPTIESFEAEFRNMMENYKSHITAGKGKTAEEREADFRKNHIYYIDGKPSDTSVTTINSKLTNTEFKGTNNDKVGIALAVGNAFDVFVRDYFNGGLKRTYDYIGAKGKPLYTSVSQQLDKFKEALDNRFSTKNGYQGYKVITEEFPIGGTIVVNGKKKTVAGTMDMVILTVKEDGTKETYIFDMKTTKHDALSAENLTKYAGQTTFYRQLLSVNSPALASTIQENTGLLVAKVSYAEDKNYSKDKDEKLLYKGKSFSSTNGGFSINIMLGNSTGKFIHELTPSNIIESIKEDIKSLTKDDLMELDSMPNGEEYSIEDFVENLKQQIEEVEKSKRLEGQIGSISEEDLISLPDDAPISKKETLRIGRTIFHTLSMLGDRLLGEDYDAAYNLAIAIFGDEESFPEDLFLLDRNSLFTNTDVFYAILNYIKDTYFNSLTNDFDEETAVQADYIYDNWNAILNTAYNVLFENEGLSLLVSDDSINVEATEGVEEGAFDLEKAYDISERELDGREAYFVDSRSVSYLQKTSKLLKRKFGKLYKDAVDEDGTVYPAYDENGRINLENVEADQFGIPTLYDKVEIINYLMNRLHNCNTLSQMLAYMKEDAKVGGKSWLYNVIAEIENSADSVFPSQFKVLFRKNKTKYNKTYYKIENDEEGNEITTAQSIPLDITDSVSKILDSVYEKTAADNPNFYTNKGSKQELLDVSFKGDQNKKVEAIKEFLEIIGFPEIENINQLKTKKYFNSVTTIVDAIKRLQRTISVTTSKNNGDVAYADLEKHIYHLASLVAPLMDSRVEISIYDAKNSYVTYTDPTYLETLISSINNTNDLSKEEYKKFLEDKFISHDQYARTLEQDGIETRVPYGSWLRMLYAEASSKSENDMILPQCIQHYVRTSYAENDYKQCNPKNYLLSMIVDYCALERQAYFNNSGKLLSLYRVPMMSDKPAWESIQGFRIKESTLEKTKDKIADEASEFFMFEVQRIADVIDKLRGDDAESNVAVYNINRKAGKELKEKLKTGKPLTFSDFANDGKLKKFIAGSGASFKFVPMINKELANSKSKFGKMIITAINNKLGLTKTEVNPIEFSTAFKKAYKAGMEEEYKRFKSYTKGLLDASDIVKLGVSDNVQSVKEAENLIEEFFWNDSLATMNILSLTVVDTAFYKNPTDLQKRYAQVHASTSKVNIEATFYDRDRSTSEKTVFTKYSDGIHRTIAINDEIVSSMMEDATEKVFKAAYDKYMREGKTQKAKQYKLLGEAIPKVFNTKTGDGVNVTDGQAYGSPTGFWKKRNMLGDHSSIFDDAIEKIKSGDVWGGCCELGNFKELVNQPFKPFIYSVIDRNGQLTPTQMKDSESMILLGKTIIDAVTKEIGGEKKIDSPLLALFQIMEDTAYDEGGLTEDRDSEGRRVSAPRRFYNGRGIDTFAFISAIKCGSTGVIDMSKYSSWEEAYDDIMNKIYLRDKKGNILLDENGNKMYNNKYVYEVPFEEWGKQQETPAHTRDHEQPMAVQGRVLSVSDFSEDAEFIVDGKTVKRDEFLNHYFSQVAKLFQKGIVEAKNRLFVGANERDFNDNLSVLIRESLVKDSKYQSELLKAFTTVDGKFPISICDPSLAPKAFSVVTSLIKKIVVETKFQGGPIVQQSPYGLSDSLHIKYVNNDPTQGYEYFECLCTCPTEEIERKMTLPDGSMMSIEEGLAKHIITEDDITIVAERIPTEDKYSMYKMRIVGFLPRQEGEKIIMPKELTTLSGTDFDIDKMYVFFKFSIKALKNKIKNLENKLASGKLKGRDKKAVERALETLKDELDTKETANDILECMMQGMSHPEAMEKLCNPGNFDILKQLAAEVDDTYNKDTYDLMYATGQLYYFTQNGAGKAFVGIGALNNVAHALANMSKLTIDLPFTFKVEGKLSYDDYFINDFGEFKIDQDEDIEGNRISRTLCTFIGAGADNAKDAVLKSINITPTTANYAMSMLRMGFPLRTVVMILNHPIIKSMANEANLNAEKNSEASFVFTDLINDFVRGLKNGDIAGVDAVSEEQIDAILKSTNITADELYKKIKNPNASEETLDNLDLATVLLMYKLGKVNDTFSALSSICQLNSTKNAVGPDEFSTRKTEYIIKETLADIAEDKGKDVKDRKLLFTDSIVNLFEKVPYLIPLVYCYTGIPTTGRFEKIADKAKELCGKDAEKGLMPQIGRRISTIYSDDFTLLLDTLLSKGKLARQFNETNIKKLFNAYILYKATKKINGHDAAIDGSLEGRIDALVKAVNRIQSEKLTIKHSGIDNSFLDNVRLDHKSFKKTKLKGLKTAITAISRDDKDDVGADWEALINSGNPKLIKLAEDIFTYMMLKYGVNFHPKSGFSLATSKVKASYKNGAYNDVFNNNISIFDAEDSEELVNFLMQYLRNTGDKSLIEENIYFSSEVWKECYNKKTRTLSITKDMIIEANPEVDANNLLAFKTKDIEERNTIYVLDSVEGDILNYKQYRKLGDGGKFYEFNAEENAWKMKSILDKENVKKQTEGARVVKEQVESYEDEEEGNPFDSPAEDINDDVEVTVKRNPKKPEEEVANSLLERLKQFSNNSSELKSLGEKAKNAKDNISCKKGKK